MTTATLLLTTLLTTAAATQQEQPAEPTTTAEQEQHKQPEQQSESSIQNPNGTVASNVEQQQMVAPSPSELELLPSWFTDNIVKILIWIFPILFAAFLYKRQEEKNAKRLEELLHVVDAKKVQEHPDEAKEIAARGKHAKTPIDKAIAAAIAYQTDQKYELAKEKWLAIANITDEQDKATAVRACFSAAYLIQEYNNEYKSKDEATINKVISLYSKTLKIEPENEVALNNRGVAKADLGQFQDAIEDYDNALSTKPNYEEALNNRGVAKTALRQCTEH